MSGVAVAIGAGALIGGAVNSDAARRGADAQRDAANNANAVSERQYDQTRADQKVWREAGEKAIGGMQDAGFQKDFSMADYQADPGFQFRMQEGAKALEGSAAARGSLHSGATLKALTRYGQDQASNEYQNAYNRFNSNADRRFNRLASLAGIGQTANNQVGQAGQNMANQVGSNMMGAGNAQAANYMAQGNAINQGIGGATNAFTNYKIMSMYAQPKPATQVAPNYGGDINSKFGNIG